MELILLGGCFWGLEKVLSQYKTTTGYSGGSSEKAVQYGVLKNINYYNLDNSDHSEAVFVEFEEKELDNVLEIYSDHSQNDPSPETKQRYKRKIITKDKELYEYIKNKGYDVSLVDEILFFKAEERHQRYYQKTLLD